MALMYTELSDMGGDLPPMAPFAVRESNLAIGRSSGSENRGGYTQPEQRYSDSEEFVGPITPSTIGQKKEAANDTNDNGGIEYAARVGAVGAVGAAGAPTNSIRSIGAIGAIGAPKAACSLGLGRGVIAPVSPMVTFGANMPLVVLVVLVLNALMMLLCAVALLSRGGRSA
jgi:hypothetical protein